MATRDQQKQFDIHPYLEIHQRMFDKQNRENRHEEARSLSLGRDDHLHGEIISLPGKICF